MAITNFNHNILSNGVSWLLGTVLRGFKNQYAHCPYIPIGGHAPTFPPTNHKN